jgi:hypothetical protein
VEIFLILYLNIKNGGSMDKYIKSILFSLTIVFLSLSGLNAANAGVLICHKRKNGQVIVLTGTAKDKKANGAYTAADFGGLKKKGESTERNAAREMCEETLFFVSRLFDQTKTLTYKKLYGKKKNKSTIEQAIKIIENNLLKAHTTIRDFYNPKKVFYRMYFLKVPFFRATELKNTLTTLKNRFGYLDGAECEQFNWIDPTAARMINGIPYANCAFPDKNGKIKTIRLRRCFYYSLTDAQSKKILASI